MHKKDLDIQLALKHETSKLSETNLNKLQAFEATCIKERETIIRVTTATIQSVEDKQDVFLRNLEQKNVLLKVREEDALNRWSTITHDGEGQIAYTWTEDDGKSRSTNNRKLYDWVMNEKRLKAPLGIPEDIIQKNLQKKQLKMYAIMTKQFFLAIDMQMYKALMLMMPHTGPASLSLINLNHNILKNLAKRNGDLKK